MTAKLWSDVRHACRMLAKNPGFAVVAILVVALGIGANTAIFSVVNAVLLKPLPYPQSDRLVAIGRKYPQGFGDSFSVPKYFAVAAAKSFQAITVYDFAGPGLNLAAGDGAVQVKGIHTSYGYPSVFGVRPVIGRWFTPQEDRPGGPRVIVISGSLWRDRFGSDPHIAGRSININHEPYTVIGVMPPGYHADPAADVWMPIQADPASTNQGHYLRVVGRLRSGVSLDSANAELALIAQNFRRANSAWMDKNESFSGRLLQRQTTGDLRPVLLVLMGAVGFVLLIACANMANLLLARATGRMKEIAVRSAMGAKRRQIVRQLLTESLVLAIPGGVLGLILGVAGVRALLLLVPGDLPRLDEVTKAPLLSVVDWRILLFTMVLSVLTGLLFGLVPAWKVARTDIGAVLKEGGGRGGTAMKHNRTRSALIVGEVALALVLLSGAALLIRTFYALHNVDLGIDPHNVLTMRISLAGSAYDTSAKVTAFAREAIQRVEAIPGVQAAAMAPQLPTDGDIDLPFTIAGKPPAKGSQFNGDEQWRFATPHYFDAFHIRLLRGRLIDERDNAASLPVLVISEAMAKKYWPKEDPVGQRITIGKGLGPEFADPARMIVGVVASVRDRGVDQPPESTMYIPLAQVPDAFVKFIFRVVPSTWIVRTAMNPAVLSRNIQAAFRQADPQIAPAAVHTMEQELAQNLARQNFNMLLLSVFAGLALLLAAIGIYGLMAYTVQQRTQEIGIRMALGAERFDMLRLVVLQALKLAAVGVAIGLAASWGLTRLLSSFLFGVKATDVTTFTVTAAVVLLTAALASFIPARRAGGIDPMVALRYE